MKKLLEEPRLLFGFLIFIALTILAIVIGLGHVEEKTSFGLQIILGALATLSGNWAQWAFQSKKEDREEK